MIKDNGITQEVFLAISGYPMYEISNFGCVRNKKTLKIIKQTDYCGLKYVSLRKNNKNKKCCVAKLLLQTFKAEKQSDNFRFIDGDTQNISLSNLEWIQKERIENDEGEVWKKISGTNGMYSVSNNGRVKNNKSENLISTYEFNGKIYCGIRVDDKTKELLLSRILAKAFIPNPHRYKFVIHKDGDFKNVELSNLEWSRQAYEKKKKPQMPKNSVSVKQFSLEGKYMTTFNSVSEAAYKSDTPYASIFLCCKKKQHTAGGYIWRFGNDNSKVYSRKNIIKLLEGEEFREIPGYPLYEVSNMGRVTSKYNKNTLLKPHKTKYGIITYSLKKDKKTHNKAVAQLMASAFISNPRKYKYIRYIDGNPENVVLSNIKWSKKRIAVTKNK